MSTAFSILLAVVVAAVAAWLVQRKDMAREETQSECSRLVTESFAGSNDTADSVILERLNAYRDKCLGDAVYVDQVRRLMTNTQRFDDARYLLQQAEARRALHPDEVIAQRAWIDAAESHDIWAANESDTRAKQFHTRAMDAANGLRSKWPEWSIPYRILEDGERSGISGIREGEGTDYFALERQVRDGKLSGAWIRNQYGIRAIVVAFVLVLTAMLALVGAANGYLTARDFITLETSAIASAKPGYVELKGTLHARTSGSALIAPHTREGAVWYELATNSGGKNATTRRERSEQPFVLRDATGDVIINPQSLEVHMQHSTTRLGNSAGQLTGRRITESLLKEGDVAYAIGELSVTTSSDHVVTKQLSAPNDGRRFFMSNYSEAQLVSMEKLWMRLGAVTFVLLLAVIVWSYYQRYLVVSQPGTLS